MWTQTLRSDGLYLGREGLFFVGKFRLDYGVFRVTRGGSGAKAPPLAARSNKAPTNKIRSAAVRHWRDISPSAYKRDLVTNEKVQFQSLDPTRTFEKFFFLPRVSSIGMRGCRKFEGSLSSLKNYKLHVYLCLWLVPSLLTWSFMLNVQENRSCSRAYI